jgi:hypothetical protein
MQKLIHCIDASITAMIALPNKSNKWDIFAISKVHGMGKADYNKKVFDFDFIEVVPLNTSSGLSYVCLNKDNKWGLLELKYNDTIQCEWKLIADFIYDDMDSMLQELKSKKNEMYYDRLLPLKTVKLLLPGGEFNWLINFVLNQPDLDFQTGKNKSDSWISIYRGTTCLLKIHGRLNGYKISVDKKYRTLYPEFYDNPTSLNFEILISKIGTYKNELGKNTLTHYYDNQKEGFYQNLISRRYGIEGKMDDPFVIIDKEVVIGYLNTSAKNGIIDSIRKKYQTALDELQKIEKFPSKLNEFKFGNEFDFLALDSNGKIIIIELKDGSDTKKIYLSPFQIYTYCDIYNEYISRNKDEFEKVILDMIKQKQELGILNSKWVVPNKIVGIRAALVIGGKYSNAAKTNYQKVIKVINKYPIETYECDKNGQLVEIQLLP